MALYELRVDLPDDPGRLAALAAALADHDVNILSLAVHGKDAASVTDDLVVDMRDHSALGSLICALHEISPQMSITKTDAHALVDGPTRALDTAAWLVRRPDQFGRALARFLGAEETQHAVTRASAGPTPGVPAAEPAPLHRLAVGVPGGGRISVWRRWAAFTITEHARAQALARLVTEVNRRDAAPAPTGPARTANTTGGTEARAAGTPGRAAGGAWLVQLADGGEVTVRRGRAPDVPAIIEMHRRCCAATLGQRYFATGQAPGPPLVRLAGTSVGGRNLIATTAEGQVVGVANLLTGSRAPGTAEVAFLVDDAWQGRGLGTAMARRIAAVAASLGITEIRAYALATNTRLPRMLRRAGYDIESRIDGTVRELRAPCPLPKDRQAKPGSKPGDVTCRPARGD
jgi:GNAT superfamily N-acetyltransferase